MTDQHQKFYNEMEMNVRKSSRRLRRIKRQSLSQINSWDVTMSDTMLYQDALTEEVECVEIYMPKDRLETIIDYIKYTKDEIEKHTTDRQLIAQYERDRVVRLKNPSVEKAYQRYVTMLELCRK